ncbi:hypothetical protein HDU80_003414, partial [Chytriomyces hyalinus]
MIAAIADLMGILEPMRDTVFQAVLDRNADTATLHSQGFFYLRAHLVPPADLHADDAADVHALVALDVGNVPPPVPRLRRFAAAGREATVLAAQLHLVPAPPPPPPATDQSATDQPEATMSHLKRPWVDTESLQGRYDLLSLHFKAGLGTGDHKTHDAMETAMRAIHDTASALRDFDRLELWAYAIALARECKLLGLSTHATSRRLAEHLGESHSSFAITGSTSKSI